MILENKTILVSGVGPGLGREIASRVLRDGGNVVIGARKAESLEAAAQELDPSGERVLAHSFDITDEESCARIITATEERFGRLDGIAQVAAAEPMGDLDSTPMQDFRTTTEVNVIGSVQLVKAAVPESETTMPQPLTPETSLPCGCAPRDGEEEGGNVRDSWRGS